jgi:hypothetical protein
MNASDKLNAGKVTEHLGRVVKAHGGIHHHALRRATAHYAGSGAPESPSQPPGPPRAS